MSKNSKKVEFQNQRVKEKILTFIYERWPNSNDIVQAEEVIGNLRKSPEFQRKNDKEL